MRPWTYRLTVIGTVLSSFLVGLHMPALHEIIEHGADVHWGVAVATLLLVVATVTGLWKLLASVAVVGER